MDRLSLPLIVGIIIVLTTISYQKIHQGRILYSKASQLSVQNRFKEAADLYEKSYQADPKNKQTLIELARTYQSLKEWDRAALALQRALQLNLKDDTVRLSLAQILSWKKDYAASIAIYKDLITRNSDIKIKKELAEVYCWNNQFDQAERIYLDLITQDPTNRKYYRDLGEIQYWIKYYEKSIINLEKALSIEEDEETKMLYAKVVHASGQTVKAKEILAQIDKKYQNNTKAKEFLADLQAYHQEYEQAESSYKELLSRGENPRVFEKLSDLYSWKKDYRKSLAAYDQLLFSKEDKQLRIKKARIYSWIKDYSAAAREYAQILAYDNDHRVILESKAKQYYWQGRESKAIEAYWELLKLDPKNMEAVFDLSQIYAWHSMWPQAKEKFNQILTVLPDNPLAKQGVEKVNWGSRHLIFDSTYDFFDAKSQSRDSDVHRHSFSNQLSVPVNDQWKLSVRTSSIWRKFSNASSLNEEQAEIKLAYMNQPSWGGDIYYHQLFYNNDIEGQSAFGTSLWNRFDRVRSKLSFDRQFLENSHYVIQQGIHGDRVMERLDIDLSIRLKAGLDYAFTDYSNGNFQNQSGVDVQYWLSLDPDRVIAKYRFAYSDFNHVQNLYFSPHDFYSDTWGISWRHYFNYDGIFFGSKDIYFETGSEITLDSSMVTVAHFYNTVHWDINQRFAVEVKGSWTSSNPDVYEDKNVIVALKYYF